MRTLSQIRELYEPDTKDGKKFVAKHKVEKTPDANKNDDKLFNASNIKDVTRQPKHGYDPKDDEKVYEGYVSHAQRKAVWASRNDEKEKMKKKIKEELELLEMDDAAGGYPVKDNLKKVPPQKPVDPKKYDKKQYDDAAGGYPVVKGDIKKEEVELDEVLKPSMGVKAYIDDFIKSNDSRFKGASKKERIQRALAAYYSAKRGD